MRVRARGWLLVLGLYGCAESAVFLEPPEIEGEPGLILAAEGGGRVIYHASNGWPSTPAFISEGLVDRIQVALLPGRIEDLGMIPGELSPPIRPEEPKRRRLVELEGVSFLEARPEDNRWFPIAQPSGQLAELDFPDLRACHEVQVDAAYSLAPGPRHAGIVSPGHVVAISTSGDLLELHATGTTTVGTSFVGSDTIRRRFLALPSNDRIWFHRLHDASVGRVLHTPALNLEQEDSTTFATVMDLGGGETPEGVQHVCTLESTSELTELRRVHCYQSGRWWRFANLGASRATRIIWGGGDRFLIGDGGPAAQWLRGRVVTEAQLPASWSFARWLPEVGMVLGTPDGELYLEEGETFRRVARLGAEPRDAIALDGSIFVLLIDRPLVELTSRYEVCSGPSVGGAAGDSWLLWNGEHLVSVSVAALTRASAHISFLRVTLAAP